MAKKMMQATWFRDFTQRQKKLSTVRQQDTGRSQAEMWLTNMLSEIVLHTAGSGGYVKINYSQLINAVSLGHDGKMTVYTYSGNPPMIETPEHKPITRRSQRHHGIA